MVRQARAMIAAGDIGTIRVVQVEYPQDWLTEHQTFNRRNGAPIRTFRCGGIHRRYRHPCIQPGLFCHEARGGQPCRRHSGLRSRSPGR